MRPWLSQAPIRSLPTRPAAWVNATTRARQANARAPAAAIDRISPEAWTPAYDADGVQRDGAVGGRVDRDDRHVGLARRDAGDRPEREPASGCPIAVH